MWGGRGENEGKSNMKYVSLGGMKNNRGKRASSVFSATCPTPPRTPFIFETPFTWPERRALVSQWKPDGISAFLGPRPQSCDCRFAIRFTQVDLALEAKSPTGLGQARERLGGAAGARGSRIQLPGR